MFSPKLQVDVSGRSRRHQGAKQDMAAADRDDSEHESSSERQDFDPVIRRAREACARSSRLIEEFKRLQTYTACLHHDLQDYDSQDTAAGTRRSPGKS